MSLSKKNLLKKLINIADFFGFVLIRFLPEKQVIKYRELISQSLQDTAISISPKTVVGLKFLCFILLLAPGFLLSGNIYLSAMLSICSGAAGFFIPDLFLKKKAAQKYNEFNSDLPYIIDLLNIATLSGQNIYNSIKILVEKFRGSITLELKRFLGEIDFGIGRSEAYKDIISRNNTESFKNLLFLMMQAEKYGSPINEILQHKSKYLRFETVQRYELKARRISILLLFPLVFLILPAFVLLVGGPLVFSIAGSFLIY